MNTLSFTSALKYAFGLFLGMTGFVPDEQTGLIPHEYERIQRVQDAGISCSNLTYLSKDDFPEYLCPD